VHAHLGVALYNGCFKAVPLKRMLLGAMLLGTALGSTQVCCDRLRITGLAGFRCVPSTDHHPLSACVASPHPHCHAQLLLVSGANRALGLSDELFVLGDSAILTVLGQVRACVVVSARRTARPCSQRPRQVRCADNTVLCCVVLCAPAGVLHAHLGAGRWVGA
jgi:hypothetical protein